ncbi:MAG TPA: hypothetical protein DDZ71_01005 [Sulfuricurvum sp.]|nr:hypothetical protein [Sulfuricurvum sp.]
MEDAVVRNLYNELSRMELKYHELLELEGHKIFLAATALIPEGIEEAMHIKRLADEYRLCTVWDGENIEILCCHQAP